MKKEELYGIIQELQPLLEETARTIWENPEVGGTEEKSANLFREIMKKEGFVIVNEEKMPHAFYAEYGSGSPVVAIIGEYDALPNMSQKATTERAAKKSGAPGHGCGHNLLGSAAAVGAICVKRFLEQNGGSGTVRFYGCPEEELLCGKVKMAYYKMFKGCDLALTWHPMSANMVYDQAYLASASVKFEFTGRTAHAGYAPEQGRSALDAVELTSVGANYLREHVPDRSRIHYTTDSGGFAPNIVPDHASAWYFTRAINIDIVKDIVRRLDLVAKGAAMMTETECKTHVEYGCCNMAPNHRFADLAYENLKQAHLPKYTKQEMNFAKELQRTVAIEIQEKEKNLFNTYENAIFEGIAERSMWERAPLNASSDSGDLSFMMPTALFSTACWPVGCAPHTWQACASNGMTIGEKGALLAAEVIANLAFDLYTKPEVVEEIKKEFNETLSGSYVPMYEP